MWAFSCFVNACVNMACLGAALLALPILLAELIYLRCRDSGGAESPSVSGCTFVASAPCSSSVLCGMSRRTDFCGQAPRSVARSRAPVVAAGSKRGVAAGDSHRDDLRVEGSTVKSRRRGTRASGGSVIHPEPFHGFAGLASGGSSDNVPRCHMSPTPQGKTGTGSDTSCGYPIAGSRCAHRRLRLILRRALAGTVPGQLSWQRHREALVRPRTDLNITLQRFASPC